MTFSSYEMNRIMHDGRPFLSGYVKTGLIPIKIMSYEDMDIPLKETASQDERAIDACLRLWMRENGHEAGNLGHEKLLEKAQNIMVETGSSTSDTW